MFFFNPRSSSLIYNFCYWLQENHSSQVKIIFITDHHWHAIVSPQCFAKHSQSNLKGHFSLWDGRGLVYIFNDAVAVLAALLFSKTF